MEDADLGDVAWVIADRDRLADVVAEHGGIEVAQAEEVNAEQVRLRALRIFDELGHTEARRAPGVSSRTGILRSR